MSNQQEAIPSISDSQTEQGHLADDPIQVSIKAYNQFRDENDEAVKIGLYGTDLDDAFHDLSTVRVAEEDGTIIPVLVPAKNLEWFNMDLLQRTYGSDTEFFYYTHPQAASTETTAAAIDEAIKTKLDSGAVIFFDTYASADGSEDKSMSFLQESGDYSVETLGGGDIQRTAEAFVGPVLIKGKETLEVHKAASLYDVNKQAIENGELELNAENGVSIAAVVEGDDAERLWEIYENPFDELGEEHPAVTGFDRDGFMEILRDPEVIKVVNRVEGKISTLCIFVPDFDHCPWFNQKYYKDNYPEYFDTDNIFMFPGIVSDEHMRGNNYSLNVIDLACKLLAKRGTNFLVTFECTETSAQYIPKIVTGAVANSGVLEITGLDKPVSITEYKAVRRISQAA